MYLRSPDIHCSSNRTPGCEGEHFQSRSGPNSGDPCHKRLETYVRDLEFDLVCIQETKLKFESTRRGEMGTITSTLEEQDLTKRQGDC